MADRYRDIRELAVKVLDEAFERLASERVLPRSRYEPWIYVGSEFEGWLLHGLPSYNALVAALETTFPDRFAKDRAAKDFASLYPFDLVTAAVARLTRAEQPYEANQPVAREVITAMIRLLASRAERGVSAYVVAGIQTSGGEVAAQGQTVIPSDGPGDAIRTIERIIPGAGHALADASLFIVGLPTALLVASAEQDLASADVSNLPFSQAATAASERLDGLISGVRLATNATVHVLAVARGQLGPFQRHRPRVRPIPYRDFLADVRRPVTMNAPLVRRLNRLHEVWSHSVSSPKGMVPSLSIAVARFNRSFGEMDWQERLVDLSVALEAAMGQEDATAEVLLRLRNRAAALLADRADDAGQIYDDLGVIYDLRSRVLHGSSQRSEKLLASISKVPATASGVMPGIKVELLIDRCRDLVRRAILARLFLAQGAKPAWPLRGSKDLDKRLADDAERKRLRQLWRNGLHRIGLATAASPCVDPVAFGSKTEATS